jgi:hypothetical protein
MTPSPGIATLESAAIKSPIIFAFEAIYFLYTGK